uniref:Immunoglobulin V-set domain-containing protein n=1 Tax=Anabas testudineus TaxID=64144 RepID=A0A3Q1J078_ANATE
MIMWFRVIRRLKPHCVSSIFKPSEPASFCDGFQNGKFETTSNMSTVFLKIKRVDLSDSGLYFCGYYIINNPVIVHATYLDVQDRFDGITQLLIVILSGLTVFLVVVIVGLIVKIKKLQRGTFTVYCTFSHSLLLNDVKLIHNFCFYHLA